MSFIKNLFNQVFSSSEAQKNTTRSTKPMLISRSEQASSKKDQLPAIKQESVLVPKRDPKQINTAVTTQYLQDNAKNIQQQLIDHNFDVGRWGADGKWGKSSQAALDQAKAAGYRLINGKLVKSESPATSLWKSMGTLPLGPMGAYNVIMRNNNQEVAKKEPNKDQDLQRQLIQAGYNLGKTGADGKWGKLSQAALDQAYKDGYELKDGVLRHKYVAKPQKTNFSQLIKNQASNPIYDNMYPYNYGDVETDSGTRQVTANDPASVQLKAGLKKALSGIVEMDPRREIMNQMAALDLNSPDGLKQWKMLAQKADTLDSKMIRYKATSPQQIKNQQWEMRARLDAMNLYQGREQQWDTYVEQQDPTKKSTRATNAGKPTLIIRDPNQRKRINGELLNYWNLNPKLRVKEDNGLVRMPVMSYLGNASIIQQSDGSLRYADDWDYAWSSKNDPNRPYFGEVLSDFSGKGFGIGVNSKSIHEGLTDLLQNLYKEKMENFSKG